MDICLGSKTYICFKGRQGPESITVITVKAAAGPQVAENKRFPRRYLTVIGTVIEPY
jgi:hypothetical protein